MGFNIGPRVVRATGGSISRAGNYRIHQFPPDIVTDGLVINLDAGNVGSLAVDDATTIIDLTGNGNNGALTNGASYSHLYGGVVQHNTDSSVDDYINVSNGGSNIMEKSFTLDFWLRYTDINAGAYTNIWSTQGYSGSGIGFAFYTYGSEIRIWGWATNGGSNGLMINPSGVLANDTWYNIVITRDMNTEKLICYKNAIGIGTANGVTADYEKDGDDTYSFGARDGANYPFEGYSSVMKGYNRALSPAEILQNYNATKIRHGVASSTTFTPTCTGSGGKVDLLCIAGGGGGGIQHGGGGGAGGYIETTGLTVTSAGTYTAAVGMGGTASPNASSFAGANGSNGGNSVFSGTSITTISSVGGGGGSCIRTSGNAGSAGGSGGGAGLEGNGAGSNTTSGGAGTSGQGFAGGKHGGYSGTNYGGGAGGGGAGGVGQDGVNGSSYIAGAGGSGKTSSITGSPVTRAGGGGGGSHSPFMYGLGGSGGGGQGGLGNDKKGDNAIPRTGSGGGGSGAFTHPAGAGSHGIIILRYPAEDYNVEMLIVGGGGGGGGTSDVDGAAGGGGGAGGLVYYESYAVKSGKNYIVEVGVGGDAGTAGASADPNSRGDNGIPSKFGDVFALGGGGAGGGYDGTVAVGRNDGQVGGSGGGGGSNGGTPANGYCLGGKGTTGQGNDGGNGSDGSGGDGAGGGGGAGTKGGDGVGGAATAQGGDGGAGLAYSITGTSTTYAGGGGGGGGANDSNSGPGAGGSGGGAIGGIIGNAGNAATANTGGGGGGAGFRNTTNRAGGDGGSGIIILAYKGPQRGEGGTVSTTSRPGYTVHTFTDSGANLFIA